MVLFVTIKKKQLLFIILGIVIICALLISFWYYTPLVSTVFVEEKFSQEIQKIFNERSESILNKDMKSLGNLYEQSKKYGIWAYEHELKKMKYLHSWSDKQGIKFTDIDSKAMIKWVKDKGDLITINLMVCSEYKYHYENNPEKVNFFRIGTYHSLDIKEKGEGWVIVREWYTDPFADSMHIDEMKSEEIKEYVLSQSSRDFSNMIERRKNALAYADEYCGGAGDKKYTYNKKYKNYNPQGGDCANFASQILYEGGKFRKNHSWNYGKGATKAWVNAHGFKDYMVYSGRASVVAHGTYDKIYKAAYKLSPGDFVAYEKKGKVTHISVVTGADSKGYTLVNSHNTDRYRVPWDLGWNDKGVKFWLVHVHF
ncbi:amidase domain-containing protein [Marinisporobacter balticus]|uniref:Putative amidase-like protein n=1 Tax=Marinisporobacter balticus TaxID=2018667 RepID=A0A4R2L1S6_9FIRM|nr:amidase domain-containing protein [Marinisporobacter balticus]TCO76508.1 putative amidase-like protein [Marinisporobacter balticus]